MSKPFSEKTENPIEIMLRLKKLLSPSPRNVFASTLIRTRGEGKPLPVIPSHSPSQWTPSRSLDIYELRSKKAIQKERARIMDEMNRGYFADMKEMNEHGGKVAMANKIIIPEMVAVKFPTLEVKYCDGSGRTLPVTAAGSDVKEGKAVIPKATLVCLSFRATSQPMVESWSSPFLDTFRNYSDVQLYEISFIDSWLLNLSPIKKLLLKVMRKPIPGLEKDLLQRQIVYAFGDHYYVRKELKILNLLTGHMFLLDKLGRVRWQGFGSATPDELSSLLSCATHLLDE